MSTQRKKITQELVNIVPLVGKSIQLGAATATPKLVYNGGPLLTSVQVCPVFWGDAWNQPAQRILSQYLFLFFQKIVSSPFISQLSEYSVPSYPIKSGSVSNIITIPHNFTVNLTLDISIRNMLKKQIANGTLPAVTPNRLYFVYLPPGVKVQKGVGVSCVTFCGYHDAISSSTCSSPAASRC